MVLLERDGTNLCPAVAETLLKSAKEGNVVRILLIIMCFLVASPAIAEPEQGSTNETFDWVNLPDMPQPISGHYAGVSNEALIIAGGANFPVPLFEGGSKVWYDDIFVLEPDADRWRTGFKLGSPAAYGATVNTDDGIICIGGNICSNG